MIESKLAGNMETARKGISATAILVGVGLFLVIGALIGNDKKKESKAENPTIQISAIELLTAYDANEVAADDKYKNKLIEVTGIVDEIGKDILDTPYVTLNGSSTVNFIQCMFTKNDIARLSALTKGQPVAIIGKCHGKVMSVIMRECVIK